LMPAKLGTLSRVAEIEILLLETILGPCFDALDLICKKASLFSCIRH
jgi:hypothetical protein